MQFRQARGCESWGASRTVLITNEYSYEVTSHQVTHSSDSHQWQHRCPKALQRFSELARGLWGLLCVLK
eukprot:4280349-Amphidinium_carterae.1